MGSKTATMAAALLFVGYTTAATLPRRNCHSFHIAVPIIAKNWTLDVSPVNNDIDTINFALNLDRWSEPNATELVLASKDVQATYTTYAELCFPPKAKDKKALQILTHGAFFDHRYCR